jgi:translation initiation factor IF-2
MCVIDTEEHAKEIARLRRLAAHSQQALGTLCTTATDTQSYVTFALENALILRCMASYANTVNIILKADTAGSLQAITSLLNFPTDIVHKFLSLLCTMKC